VPNVGRRRPEQKNQRADDGRQQKQIQNERHDARDREWQAVDKRYSEEQKRPNVIDPPQTLLLRCVCQSDEIAKRDDAGEQQGFWQGSRSGKPGNHINQQAAKPHNQGADRVCFVPRIIKHNDGGQQRARGWKGQIVTNPNCSAIGLVLALAPLQQKFGLETVMAVTMQAVSGAGYPGVASLDILGNVIPFIRNEEEKMEEETRKLLGQLKGSKVIPGAFAMSAQCNRVAVEDGHTESVSIRLKTKAKPEEIIAAWNDYRSEPQQLKLPSAPERPVVYLEAVDRPQPRFDVDLGSGMTTAVGRLRPCGVLDWKFTVLSHNTIRGAAGAAVLNAELLKAKGYLG